jgi:hypothetical protein
MIYLYIKKLYPFLVVTKLMNVSRRRADIELLIQNAWKEAHLKGKHINTVDPLVICAKRLFPYLPDPVLHEYARTALRVIRNEPASQPLVNSPQTTLLTHFVR